MVAETHDLYQIKLRVAIQGRRAIIVYRLHILYLDTIFHDIHHIKYHGFYPSNEYQTDTDF